MIDHRKPLTDDELRAMRERWTGSLREGALDLVRKAADEIADLKRSQAALELDRNAHRNCHHEKIVECEDLKRRLAEAKEQLAEMEGIRKDLLAIVKSVEKERDEARAEAAAALDMLTKILPAIQQEPHMWGLVALVNGALSQPGPGAALLEELNTLRNWRSGIEAGRQNMLERTRKLEAALRCIADGMWPSDTTRREYALAALEEKK